MAEHTRHHLWFLRLATYFTNDFITLLVFPDLITLPVFQPVLQYDRSFDRFPTYGFVCQRGRPSQIHSHRQ